MNKILRSYLFILSCSFSSCFLWSIIGFWYKDLYFYDNETFLSFRFNALMLSLLFLLLLVFLALYLYKKYKQRNPNTKLSDYSAKVLGILGISFFIERITAGVTWFIMFVARITILLLHLNIPSYLSPLNQYRYVGVYSVIDSGDDTKYFPKYIVEKGSLRNQLTQEDDEKEYFIFWQTGVASGYNPKFIYDDYNEEDEYTAADFLKLDLTLVPLTLVEFIILSLEKAVVLLLIPLLYQLIKKRTIDDTRIRKILEYYIG